MDIKVEQLSPLRRKMTIVLPAATVQKELDQAFKQVKAEAQIRGFRRGKVPAAVLERNFGQKMREEVAERLVEASYFDAVEKEKLDPVVHPEIVSHTYNDDGSFTYQAEIDLRPEFELSTYKGIEIEEPEIVVSDQDVEAELEQRRRDLAPLRSVVGRPVQKGDLVRVDFQIFEGDTTIFKKKKEDVQVEIGAGSLNLELEEKIAGMNDGEEAVHEIFFPAGYPNQLFAGKTIRFLVTVKDIQERVLPELDDDFAKDIDAAFSTLDELKEDMRRELRKFREEAMSGSRSDMIMKRLLDAHTFELPERLIFHEISELIKLTEENLLRRGQTLEGAGIRHEDLITQHRPTAEMRVRGDFILKKIAAQENISLSDADIQDGFLRLAERYGMSPEDVQKYFGKREFLMPFMHELLIEKILAFLREHAVIRPTAPAVSAAVPEEKP